MAYQRLPSLKGIEAFVCAANTLSFRDAADQLFLTTSAISRRIQLLEEQLNTQLFERCARAVRLTEAGRTYLSHLTPGLDIIREASNKMLKGGQDNCIRIACTSLISAQWLHPRISDFMEVCPDSDFEVFTLESLKFNNSSDVDLCIGTMNDGAGQSSKIRLFEMDYFPICAPRLLEEADLKKPSDLENVTLLRNYYVPDSWPNWLQAAGVPGLMPRHMVMIEEPGAYHAAICQGMGVGLGGENLTGESLRKGEVVRLFDISCRYPRSAYLQANNNALQRPVVRAFHDWLVAAA